MTTIDAKYSAGSRRAITPASPVGAPEVGSRRRSRTSWLRRIRWDDPATLFLILASPLGIVYLVATPPMQVPDELRHLRRTVQIANSGVTGGVRIPSSIVRFARTAKAAAPIGARKHARPFSVASIRAAAAIPLRPDATVYFAGDRALVYSPVAYLPAVAAIAAASAAGLRPLVLLYLGRLSLLVAGVALLYGSIRLAPTLRWPLCFLALLPMTTFMRSALSADTLTTAFAVLLFATILWLREDARPIGAAGALLLASVGSCLALCKIGYLPLTTSAFVLPRARFASRRAHRLTLILAVAVPLLVTLLWLHAVGDFVSTDNPHRADPDAQLRLLAAQPWRFASTLAATWLAPHRLWLLAETFVGRLLVLTVHLPPLFVPLCFGLLIVLLALEPGAAAPRAGDRLLLVAAVLACAFVISVGAYLKWTSVGGGFIRGIQGRYLYPLAPFVLFALLPPRARRWRCPDRVAALLVAAVSIAANAWGIVAIVASTWAA